MNNKLAFYRKYRPSCFKEIVGQEFIIKTLQNSIVKNKLSHAYIFSGPRGVGKTSIAKIFSKAINCLNSTDGDCCNNCERCKLINQQLTTDVIELDAASNNGVNEIRDIIDTIGYLPNSMKKKVYIIDEAHMLTNASWNAFLKSIEDPPHHLIFIFATTEPHKFPPTIISRCQRYNFLKLNNLELKKQIEHISKQENIFIDDESIKKIILLADGSLRDACSIIDQLDSYTNSNIKIEDVNKVFGLIDVSEKIDLIKDIISNDVENAIKKINNFENIGTNFYQLSLDIVEIFFDKLVYEKTKKANLMKSLPAINAEFFEFEISEIISCLKILEEHTTHIKNSNNQKIFFEILCFELAKVFSNKDVIKKRVSTKTDSNLNTKEDKTSDDSNSKKTETENLNQDQQNNIDNEQEKNFKYQINDVDDLNFVVQEENEKQKTLDTKNNNPINNFLIKTKKDSSIVDDILRKAIIVEHCTDMYITQKSNQKLNDNTIIDKIENLTNENTILSNTNNFLNSDSQKANVQMVTQKLKNEMNLEKKKNVKEIEEISENLFNMVESDIEQNYISSNIYEDDSNNRELKEDNMLKIVIHNNKENLKLIDDIINKIKNKVPTNLIEANIIDIKKVVAVSNNGIIFLAKDNINAKTLNDLSTTFEFISFMRANFPKIFYCISVTNKEMDAFAKKHVGTSKSKKDVDDIKIDFLLKKIDNKFLAREVAEECLSELIVEEE